MIQRIKKSLVESIKKVLSKAVDDHKMNLHYAINSDISYDFEPFEKLDKDKLLDAKVKLKKLSEAIKNMNACIQEKYEKPYTPILDKSFNIQETLDDCNKAMMNLEKVRSEYNEQYDNEVLIIKELKVLNDEIAYYEIIDSVNEFNKYSAKMKGKEKQLEIKTNEYNTAKNELIRLKSEQKNINIAPGIINRGLRYIFFAAHRMEISNDGENYKLLSNGRMVKPSDISVGERNIIGLCYFFAEMLREQEIENVYSKESLVVLDDPVSSFDLENKVGIMSFLREIIGTAICGNQNTKVIIMTHDLPSFYDMKYIFEEVSQMAGKLPEIGKSKCNFYELENKQLKDFSYKNRHEYSALLKEVYEYAAKGDETYESTIGNEMRRVLEAFSTFTYREGISTISRDQEILDQFHDKRFEKYFQNLMYRLVLNGESHLEERTRALDDPNFFDLLSSHEKQITAKSVIVFIYLLNDKHVLNHLKDDVKAKSNIESWKEEILKLKL